MEMDSVGERGISAFIIIGVVAFAVVVGVGAALTMHPSGNPPDSQENQDGQGGDEGNVVLTGTYTNEEFLSSLENERQEFVNRYISPIYSAPRPLPEKFNCIWVPLPEDWKEILERVDEVKAMGFNSVHFGAPVLLDENQHPYLVALDLVKFYINEFHREGMYVILTTNAAGPWFGTPYQGDAAFIDEYSQVIYELADIAEEFDVAAFIPANEYQLLAQSHDIIRDIPSEILPEVRARYGGLVGFNIQGQLDYALDGYDFVLMMGRTASVDPVTRDMALNHQSEVVREDIDFMRSLADADPWFGFLMFDGAGNYWEPNNGVPEMSVTAEEAAQYAETVLETAYDNLSGVMPCYDTGFYVLEDPLPAVWQKYFSSYNRPEQNPAPWSAGDLDVIHEVLFPEWDGMYTKPWNQRMDPGYWADISLTGDITVSGLAKCKGPDYIQITGFTFQGDGRDIEIRLADNNTGELLVNSARLMALGTSPYEGATLNLYYPMFLKSHMFDRILIYDSTNRQVLGQYEFSPEGEVTTS